MKKEKELLLIASIIGYFYTVISFILSLVTKSMFSNNMALNILNYTIYSLGILSSSVLLYLSISKKSIENKYGLIIICSIILFLVNIASGIIGFVVAGRIRKKSKKELPKLEIQHNYKWFIYLSLLLLWVAMTFFISDLLPKKLIVIILEYIFLFLVSTFIFRKDLKRDFGYFKNYFKEYFAITIKNYGKSLLVLAILSISISLYTGTNTSTNQQALNTMFEKSPLFVAVLVIVYAPIVEEIIFRGVLRKFINNKWIFIFVSGILFGIAHVVQDITNLKQLLFVLVYSSLGCFLAHTYYKTNNIFTNIMFHCIQNTIAVLGMLLLSFFPDLISMI